MGAVRGTKAVRTTVAVVTAAQFAITCPPSLPAVFETQTVSLHDGLLNVGGGVTLCAIIEVEKPLRLRLRMMRAV